MYMIYYSYQSNDFRPQRNATELISKFEQRTSDLVRIPHEHTELLQILEYKPGQYYHSHEDASLRVFKSKWPVAKARSRLREAAPPAEGKSRRFGGQPTLKETAPEPIC